MAAEQGVLGGILLHGDQVMTAVAGVLEPEDFYNRHHADVYLAMHQLWDRGQPVDEITVSGYLRDQDRLAKVGGPSFLAELGDTIISPAHVEHYAKMVRTKAKLRQIAAAQALDPAADPDEALAEAERLLMASRERSSADRIFALADLLPEIVNEFKVRQKMGRDPNALPCGFKAIDRMLDGGMRPGDMIVGAGRPSMGKTSFGLSVAMNVGVKQNRTVFFCSQEQVAKQLAGLMLCSWSQVNTQAWRSGRVTPEGAANLEYTARRLERAPIYFFDSSAEMAKIRSHARLLKLRHKLSLLIFDHIQRFAKTTKHEDIGEVSRQLKDLALDLKIPILVLCQISRKGVEGPDHRPILESLKGSGSIEEDSDVVLLFYRPAYYDKKADKRLTEVMIGKQKNGPTGKVELVFKPEFVRFEDMEAGYGLFDQGAEDRAVA